ncbi:MAG: hypothetical protein KDL87_06950, partial [Verrucomicrobiae bacterium]|nr:hypothetical protein [Verrucomicrobiae bacterium]
YQIDELDRHRTQSAHELRNAREAADAVFAQIGGKADTGEGPLEEGSIEWENLQKTKSFIEQNLKNSESDPSKELERARDLHHLAQIDARLGNSEAARDRLKQAVGAFETVLAERSNEPKVVADCEARLADCHETLAGMMDQDFGEERLHELKEAARLLKRLGELRPQDAQLAMRRLGADFRLGRQLHEHRDFPSALATFTSVGAQLDRQIKGEPESRPLREMVAEVQYHSALTLREVGRTKEAADAFTAAMETITELCGDLPPTEEQCVRLGGIYADLGEMFSGQATDEECGQLLNEACRLLNPVHDRRPEHLETAITLGRALSRLALIDQRANRWSDGYKMSVSAVEGVEKALESDPSSIEGRLTLIELRGNHLELVKYQRGTAKKILTKGFDMAESVREDLDAAVTLPRAIRDGWRLRLAGLYETYGNVSKALGDDEKARLCHERANQAREVLVTQGPVQEVAPTVEATRAESL